MSTQRRVNTFLMIVVCCLSTLLPISLSEAQETSYWIIVDEHDTPLPAPPPQGSYYNCTGGDRGKLHEEDIAYTWDGDSAYTAEVIHMDPWEQWTWGGMWYSLIRINRDDVPLDFRAILGPYVKPEYQGEITEVEIVLSNVSSPSNNPNLELRLELKDKTDTSICSNTWGDLTSGPYPKTCRWSLSEHCKQKVKLVLWTMDNAQVGDSVSIDRVKLRARVPDLTTIPTDKQAFLWTYSWLMANYNPDTGIVQDRSNFGTGDMENITATAKAAKIAYYAYKKGYTSRDDAEAIITKIADTLINVVPRGPSGVNTLWPHFAKNGGTEPVTPHDGYAGTEWASGDTAYAALDIITALQLIRDPQSQIIALEDFLEAINWTDLLSPEEYIYHGYFYEGDRIPSCWKGFGMETIGANWAYASATGNVAEMQGPPSDNGSGFIDNAQYPLVFSGQDRWGNDWDTYRNNMADIQIAWYCTPEHNNVHLCNAGLFGLSAAETPESDSYIAYGVGGRYADPQDGNGMVVLHYSGMIADRRPAEAIAMWETLRDRKSAFLQDRVVISPLNNMESMKVDKTTGALTINHLKGSWNLALQAEGWAMRDPDIRNDLSSAIQNNPFLNRGYTLLRFTNVLLVSDIPDQTITEGETFASIPLDDYVSDPNYADEELTWTYSGNSELTVSIVDRVAIVTAPDGWYGSETITFRATNPDSFYDEDSTVFTVRRIIFVPVDYLTVQEAINAATSDDTILVAPGTYNEHLILKSGILLKGSGGSLLTPEDPSDDTVIDGMDTGRAIYCDSVNNVTIEGFTIRNGAGEIAGGNIYCKDSSRITIRDNLIADGRTTGSYGGYGGGLYVYNSQADIVGNVIKNNWAWHDGGGISFYHSDGIIANNIIFNNDSDWGGGIYCSYSSPLISNNIIDDNFADYQDGGGTYCYESSPVIVNNTFINNKAGQWNNGQGGAIYLTNNSSPKIFNNIVVNNTADNSTGGIYCISQPSLLAYNDVYGNMRGNYFGCTPGPGSISEEPLFVNPAGRDYRSQSGSPCINAGDPDPNYNDLDGTHNDMGAYGGPFAEYWFLSLVDLNNDSTIDFKDYAIFAGNWLKQGPSLEGDINGNGLIDRIDLKLLVLYWLK